jgi:hypothetical protein
VCACVARSCQLHGFVMPCQTSAPCTRANLSMLADEDLAMFTFGRWFAVFVEMNILVSANDRDLFLARWSFVVCVALCMPFERASFAWPARFEFSGHCALVCMLLSRPISSALNHVPHPVSVSSPHPPSSHLHRTAVLVRHVRCVHCGGGRHRGESEMSRSAVVQLDRAQVCCCCVF